MRSDGTVKKGALRYLAILLFQRLLGLLLFAAAAGTVRDLRGILYFSFYFGISLIAGLFLYRDHRETLNERGKRHADTKDWDRVLLPVYVLLAFYGVHLVAGLGVRFQWPQLSGGWLYAGVVLYLVSGVLTVWSVAENRHFESTSRIQEDRAQTVVSTGPYRLVRHPGYLGVVVWAAAVTLIFGTLAVGLTALVIAAVIAVRTGLEDAMLRRELDGYLRYAGKVKYRLIPFVW